MRRQGAARGDDYDECSIQAMHCGVRGDQPVVFFFFKQKTAYEIGLGIPAEPLFRSNIYNNYFKAPWMPDRTEANPNELNQDDARYGFRCCHLKNIWTAPLPPETELSRQMTTSTTSIDIMGLQAAYANLHTD